MSRVNVGHYFECEITAIFKLDNTMGEIIKGTILKRCLIRIKLTQDNTASTLFTLMRFESL